jgi:hypothetical protein
MTERTILTTKGYSIRKDKLLPDQEALIKRELTVSPKVLEKFAKGVKSFPVFLESSTRYYLPRVWGQEHFGLPEAITLGPGISLPSSVTFKGNPYPYQTEIIETFLKQGANGLICVPCGRGKTFMALAIALRLRKRFLILVDKEFLANQWKGEIERYVEGARIGVVQGPKAQVDPALYDITICMIQTICLHEYPADTFSGYGFTIFDECHHLGAQHFSGVLRKIQTKHICLNRRRAMPEQDCLFSIAGNSFYGFDIPITICQSGARAIGTDAVNVPTTIWSITEP